MQLQIKLMQPSFKVCLSQPENYFQLNCSSLRGFAPFSFVFTLILVKLFQLCLQEERLDLKIPVLGTNKTVPGCQLYQQKAGFLMWWHPLWHLSSLTARKTTQQSTAVPVQMEIHSWRAVPALGTQGNPSRAFSGRWIYQECTPHTSSLPVSQLQQGSPLRALAQIKVSRQALNNLFHSVRSPWSR